MLKACVHNQLVFRYVLNDVWSASSENMTLIKTTLKKDFVMPVKTNRKVALSEQDKNQGRSQSVKTLAMEAGAAHKVWREQVEFPLLLVKQVFLNKDNKGKDNSQGFLYLITSDLTLDGAQITRLYQRQWQVEEYHKSLKQNASLTCSPTRTVRTQTNHLFCSLCAFVKLEALKIRTQCHHCHHFALKNRLYQAALQAAFNQLQKLGPENLLAAASHQTMKKPKVTPSQRFALALAANALPFGALMLTPIGRPSALAQSSARVMAPLPANSPCAAEINAFGETDRKQMPPVGAVLFIGSSSIRFWSTLAQDFPEIPVINRGFGGSFIQDSTLYADRIAIPYRPKIIILCAGTNDLAYGNKTPQQVSQDYQVFVAKIHAALPDTRFVYLAINPTVARWKQEPRNLEVNYLIEKFSVETNSPTEKLSFIDPHAQLLTADDQPQPRLLRADGLHFNAAGYKVWASLVKPRVLALAALDGVKRLDTPKTAPTPQ